MISNLKTILIELQEYIKDEIEELGGIRVLIAFPFFLIALPFFFLFLFIKKAYQFIRMLIDLPRIGPKKAYQKNFYPDEYEEDDEKVEQADKKESLLPDGRHKAFQDWEDWPDAYAVDGIAIYGAEGRTLLYVDENVKEFVVPEGVVNIYHRCFFNCNELERVVLPKTLKRMGKMAFKNCASLEEMIIPDSVNIIGAEMLMNCMALEKLILPSQIREIPPRAFSNCRRIQEVKLPEQMKSIGEEAFQKCSSLKHIALNEQLETVGKRAFEGCCSLQEFIMPESVKGVSEGEFNGCSSLQHIHLSGQTNDFGGSCCQDCWNIKEISMTPFGNKEREYFEKQWKEYADEVDIEQSEKPFPECRFWTMDDTLYFGVPRLSTVCLVFSFTKKEQFTIPSFVTNIKPKAFVSCKNLRTLRVSPNIMTGDDPWASNNVTYDFIYRWWPQVERVILDERLNYTQYAFELIA